MNWLIQSLHAAAVMFWETFWALVLGLGLSAFLQVFLRREEITKQFGRTGLREVGLATLLGAISSSCSYAAAATAKTAFKKGAALVPTLAFMFASTNLVLELGFLLWLLLGWQFVLAEVVGAIILIAVMWLLVRLTLPKGLVEAARAYEGGEVKSCCGDGHDSHMGGDGEMGMGHEHGHHHDEDEENAPFREKMRDGKNWVRAADAFFMDAKMLWKEITIGFLIAGFLMVMVPMDLWGKLFITHNTGFLHLLENAIVGPLVGVASFACSCGNIPLASVLWAGGISFGGVISFVYADLVIVPLILIYGKYYGVKPALYITAVLFVSMVVAGIVVDLLFQAFGLVPTVRSANMIMNATFQWNYTSYLDIAAALVVGAMIWGRMRVRDA